MLTFLAFREHFFMSLMYAYFLLNMKKTQDPNYLFPRLLIEVVCMAIKLERRGHISMGTMSNIEHAHCWGQSRCTGGSHLHGPDLVLEDSDKKMMYTADTHAGNIKHLASWSFMSLTKEWQETKLCFISKIKNHISNLTMTKDLQLDNTTIH